jgi:hypothetical protein
MDSVPEDVAAVLGSSEDSFTALVIAVGSAACSGSGIVQKIGLCAVGVLQCVHACLVLGAAARLLNYCTCLLPVPAHWLSPHKCRGWNHAQPLASAPSGWTFFIK